MGVRERGRQPLIEPAAALPDDVEPGGEPVPRSPREREHPAGERRFRGGGQAVAERRLRQQRRVLRG